MIRGRGGRESVSFAVIVVVIIIVVVKIIIELIVSHTWGEIGSSSSSGNEGLEHSSHGFS
jgi:preprotein translocase subunit SecG